jgi:hypothetical protein
MLQGVPRLGVGPVRFGSEVFLGPASAPVVAVVIIGANRSLAGHTLVSGKAPAQPRATVTEAFIGALCPGVEVVGIHNLPYPREVFGAGAQGAVWTRPPRLSIGTGETLAVDV